MILTLFVMYLYAQPVLLACPPIQLKTVLAACTLEGKPIDCALHPVPVGTLATFRCKPGLKIKFGYLPASSFVSRCGLDGVWSDGPFRCERERTTAPPTTQAALWEDEACPPIQLKTVLAACTLEGKPIDCALHPVPVGTLATFRCKPGLKIKFGYLPASSFVSRCGLDGVWSDGPFRCERERTTAPPTTQAALWEDVVTTVLATTQAQAEGQVTTVLATTQAQAEGQVTTVPSTTQAVLVQDKVVCPPLKSKTVLPECRLEGQSVECEDQPAPVGTVARFRCKPLHQFLFGYLPDSRFQSRCGADGQWTVRPFRCEPICGQPTGKGIGFIRDGNLTSSAADFPWHVIIFDLTQDMKQICGGTLISAKFVVSAAHCFHDGKKALFPTMYMAGFGKIKRSVSVPEPNEQYRELEKIYLKDFGGIKELYSNDIALLQLTAEVDITAATMPACMDWGLQLPSLRHRQRGAVVGFGDTSARSHDNLRFGMLPFINSAECKRDVSESLAVYNKLPDKFCIGFVNRTTVAKGDSGGGIAFPDDDRVWYLRGVVSLGSSQETTVSFFTNVTLYVPWISSIIQRGEMSGRRCGVDVNQASVVSGEPAGQFDFPWEVDVYFKETSKHNFESLTTGALVKPNLIITRAKVTSSTGQPIDLAEYPAAWLRVTSRLSARVKDLQKARNISEVVRSFFPSDVLSGSGLFYNFVLLELKQPLHLMPVCLDWTGGALLLKERYGMSLRDREQDDVTMWTRLPILNATACKKKVTPQPNSHHICTFQSAFLRVFFGGEGSDRLHNSLYVFADNTWFLRGVVSQNAASDNGTVSIYTDMSDRGIREWLAKTSDMMGRPTCGNVHLCEPLRSGLSLSGHMPWSVAVEIQDGTGNTVQRSGILIEPNAVLTDASALVNLTAWDGSNNDLANYTDSLSVLWTDTNNRLKTSRVVRISLYESAEAQRKSRRRFDIALLELHPDQPVFSTPVCLDLNGNVLQQLATGQLGLVEAWASWGPANHSLVSVPYMLPTECNTQLQQSMNRSRESIEFCTLAGPGVLDSAAQGGGYLVSSGSQWFLQGLFTDYARLRHRTIFLAADFRDAALRRWLRGELNKLKKVTSKPPEEKTPTNCVGGRPSETDCGFFNSKDELQDDNDFIFKTSRNRMEWNVQVHVNRGAPLWDVRAGVLVRTSMVLTSALDLFVRSTNESSSNAIPASDVIVKYLTADGRGPFSVEVQRIHLRERLEASWHELNPHLHFDLALLELSAAVTLMPACVPTPGPITAHYNAMSEGLIEVWEDTYSSQRTLLPAWYRQLGQCNITLNRLDLSNAEFCAETKTGDLLRPLPIGAGFSILSQGEKGAWFVRGIHGTDWNTTFKGGPTPIFYFLDLPVIKSWIHEKMQLRSADGTSLSLPVPKPQPFAAPAGTPSAKCGQTSLPLYSLAFNQFGLIDMSEPPITLTGPLPWSVAIYIGNNFETFTSGVLVRENVVLTDANMLVVPRSSWNESGIVRTVDPSEVRVMWVSHTGRRQSSQVLSVQARERDRGTYQTSRTFDVALLRLKTPLPNSPACWSRHLPKLKRYQLGVIDAWNVSVLDFQSDVLAMPYVDVGLQRCAFSMLPFPYFNITPERYCTGPVKVPAKAGAGFLVRRDDSWFLHGILSFIVVDKFKQWVITDVAEEGVSTWLHDNLEGETKPEAAPQGAPPSEPSAPSQCGKTTLSLHTLKENDTLANHLPWSMVVYTKDTNGTVRMRPGVLVRHDIVLTGASLSAKPLNLSEAAHSASTFVAWVNPSGRRLRFQVLAVHIYHPDSSSDMVDLALLQLQSPFPDSMVACVDTVNPPPSLADGQLGVMETWNGDPFSSTEFTVVARAPESSETCQRLYSNSANMTSEMFCLKGTRAQEHTLKKRHGNKIFLHVKPGSGFLVRKGDSWFLRGVVASSVRPASEDTLVFTDLGAPDVRAWLQEKLSSTMQ
ncbi:uncharacterized protein LOC117644454 isoform X2 [Thrips palmi]|uniref:Uncharacterized protein LOC117644454 isoform X2 n=1 Tax=Thrips palmi TaxID=161013 RepID=A0A6P8YS44_THRPL|nr:uncharacterized protein LOC117644454 isoform X2 [Thrips palmi]